MSDADASRREKILRAVVRRALHLSRSREILAEPLRPARDADRPKFWSILRSITDPPAAAASAGSPRSHQGILRPGEWRSGWPELPTWRAAALLPPGAACYRPV